MSGVDETLHRSKEEMRLIARILTVIPRFTGYKEKELRRESDKLIRDHLYRRLREAKDSLKEVSQKLSDHRLYGVLEDIDRLVMKFDRVNARIDHASYGYSGFFNIIKIQEKGLEEMLSFDSNLIEAEEKLFEDVKALKGIEVKEIKKIRRHLDTIRSTLKRLEETFNERKEKILGVR